MEGMLGQISPKVRYNYQNSNYERRIIELWKTRSGLVEQGPWSTNKVQFGDALYSILGHSSMDTCVESRARIELQDMDELTSMEVVTVAGEPAVRRRCNIVRL